MGLADEKWYAGHSNGEVVVIMGMTETLLPHHVRHSPDGFSWGYGGSGPADLARCILIDALGNEARCTTCAGTGVIVYVDGEAMSVARAEQENAGGDWRTEAYTCHLCDDGITVDPPMYQAFKFNVIARMTMDQPWSMSRSQVMAWHEAYAREKEHA